MTAWPLLTVLGAAVLVFALTWAVALWIRNLGIVDIVWSYSFLPAALYFAVALPGWAPRRWAIAFMAGAWSLRLGTYLARRVLGHHPTEDGRYRQLRKEWGSHVAAKSWAFFEFQALLVAILIVPFFFAARNPRVGFQPLEWAAIVLWAMALCGEAVADAQMAAFKREPKNRGKVCDAGLWGRTRHPNYFCEWLIWVAYALFALAAPGGWIALYCPALMLFFLLKVTGVAYTEAQLLRSKGEAYRRYQAATPAFFPKL